MSTVPTTLAEALDPDWLTGALVSVSGGAKVMGVDTIEVIRTMATKVRFTVHFEGQHTARHYCLKAFLDVDAATARGGSTTVLEADFYAKIAPHVNVRVPDCVVQIIDRAGQQGIIIMRDLIVDGARFCSALDAFTADECADSLKQIAHLHAGCALLDTAPWIVRRVTQLAHARYIPTPTLQEMMDGERGAGLPSATKNAARLVSAMKSLAGRDEARPQCLVHGDAHAGNIYRTADGPGLIDWQLLQRGGWALDVAYHINAVLPVDVAEREERALLDHYLETARGHHTGQRGCALPDREKAWAEYREACVYGCYLWAITRRVDLPIIKLFFNRLGSAVTRHKSFELLGV